MLQTLTNALNLRRLANIPVRTQKAVLHVPVLKDFNFHWTVLAVWILMNVKLDNTSVNRIVLTHKEVIAAHVRKATSRTVISA